MNIDYNTCLNKNNNVFVKCKQLDCTQYAEASKANFHHLFFYLITKLHVYELQLQLFKLCVVRHLCVKSNLFRTLH